MSGVLQGLRESQGRGGWRGAVRQGQEQEQASGGAVAAAACRHVAQQGAAHRAGPNELYGIHKHAEPLLEGAEGPGPQGGLLRPAPLALRSQRLRAS